MTANTTQSSYSWLRSVPGELFDLDEKPLLGFPPPFPWQNYAAEIARTLQIEGLTISPGELQWRSTGELFDGLGDKLKTIALNVSPLNGGLWWVMPEKGYTDLMESVFSVPVAAPGETVDENILTAFTQFLAGEAIAAFQKLDFDKKLSPVVLNESEQPKESCLSLDVSIKSKQHTIYGRLLISSPFRKAWAARYLQDQNTLVTKSPATEALNVIVHIEAGKFKIKPSDWQKIVPGDFVIVDSCTLDPDEDKGRVNLVINGQPFFRAKIKDGSIKILEHPLYHEVDTAMSTPPKDHEDSEEFDDADFDLDDDKTEDEDIDIDDIGNPEADEDAEDEDAAPPAKPKAVAKDAAAEKPTVIPSVSSKSGPLSVDEIPLPVVIEVGRIKMSVKKLLELQPGNMLELDIHPESGVDMVVNGKRVARGELLRIGDTLGLRVTELS